MATTTPFPFGQIYDPAAHSEERQTIVAKLIGWYEGNLGDSDKAADGYDAGYYGGAADAYFDALVLLTGADPDMVAKYQRGDDPLCEGGHTSALCDGTCRS